MPVTNADIARVFYEIADLLDIKDANQYRVRAYRNAASTIERHPKSIPDMLEAGDDLTELAGIGKDLAEKIEEIVETGGLQQLEELKQEVSPELAELMSIPGLGAKRVQQLHEELDISTIAELEKAAKANRVQQIPGFGEKTQQKILDNIRHSGERRTSWFAAEQVVEPLVNYLRSHDAVDAITVAGSYRRRKDTVGDLDIVIVSEDGASVSQHLVDYDAVNEVVAQGKTRSTVILRSDLQVDVRVVAANSYGAALHYFTGSKAHNLALRNMALDRDLKINEYGIWDGDEQIAGRTEDEMYSFFDMPVIPPEMRENRGEIEAARSGKLPKLITIDDLRGDLHAHTVGSDGAATLEEMAEAAQARGYDYLAITDHSPYISITQGMDASQLAAQIDRIDELNEGFDGFRLLKGCEVDILEDGRLDMPDDVLERLDLCVCAIHSRFDLSRRKQTERILKALDNPNTTIIGHPTGRRIGQRKPMDIDMERVMEAAHKCGCYLEINADPDRLDLNDVAIHMAKDIGLKLAIATDAHKPSALAYMRFGVYQARRGWLTADDVINTRTWDDLKGLLDRG